jgi:hypothetical protein
MFDELSQDFGSVPRGPALNHAFHLTNKTGATVHIANVRVSCGCTTAWALAHDVGPGKETSIMAQMDTRRFIGTKTVTIYVTIDQPQYEEVRLWVSANSRDDVTLTPEALAFGTIRHGEARTASVNLSFLGYGDTRIVDGKSDSNYVQTRATPTRREGGEVTYQITAKLRPDLPVGKWYTDIWLSTSNPSAPKVRVPLTVEVEPALTVTPSVASLGSVKRGGEIEKKIIVRGDKPFRITQVKGTDGQITVNDTAKESRTVHILTVRFKAAQAGEVIRTFRVYTDLKDENEVAFQATAHVED